MRQLESEHNVEVGVSCNKLGNRKEVRCRVKARVYGEREMWVGPEMGYGCGCMALRVEGFVTWMVASDKVNHAIEKMTIVCLEGVVGV